MEKIPLSLSYPLPTIIATSTISCALLGATATLFCAGAALSPVGWVALGAIALFNTTLGSAIEKHFKITVTLTQKICALIAITTLVALGTFALFASLSSVMCPPFSLPALLLLSTTAMIFSLILPPLGSFTLRSLFQTTSFEIPQAKTDSLPSATSYKIIPTLGDGACGLHALLGKINERGICVWEGSDTSIPPHRAVREHFVKTLRKALEDKDVTCHLHWQEMMQALLKDYLANPSSFYARELFAHVEDQIESLRATFVELESEKTALMLEVEEYLERAAAGGKVTALLAAHPQKTLFNLLEEDFTHVIAIIKQDSKPIAATLENNKNARVAIEQRRANVLERFVSSDAAKEGYFKGVLNENYYFTTAEIELAALLFQKRLTIYAPSHENTFLHKKPSEKISEVGREEDPHVVIFHEGIHFSRCK